MLTEEPENPGQYSVCDATLPQLNALGGYRTSDPGGPA